MAALTQRTAANAEESASAATELSAQAGEMNALASQFRLSTVTTAPAAPRAAAPRYAAPPSAKRRPSLGGSNGYVKAASVIPFDDDDSALAEF
jgi:methyl-accepting chemotaxis protein